jgi:hypothetical protein
MPTPGYPDSTVTPSLVLSSSVETFPSAYLTADEYKNAPIAVDLGSFTYYDQPQDETAALLDVIRRASEWMDNFCNQRLTATQYVENQRARIDKTGVIRVHPYNWPLIQLKNFAYGYTQNSMVSVTDLSGAWLETQQFSVPLASGVVTNQGALSFNSLGPATEILTRYTYISGYVNTTIATASNAATSSITVSDSTAIYAGTSLNIVDGRFSEQVTVSSVSGNTVTLSSPLSNAHAVGTGIHAMPGAVKEAAILVTTSLIKARGQGALTPPSLNSASQMNSNQSNVGNSELSQGMNILKSYSRRR